MKKGNIVTVDTLISFLENNFQKNERLCFWHEGGAWCECEYVYPGYLGSMFLVKVRDDLESRKSSIAKVEERDEIMRDIKNSYREVKRDDIILY